MSLPPRIALVGFMGAGKTTVGRRLSARAGYRFADTDAEIEARAGMRVPEIFRSQGEESFRALEAQVIESLLTEQRIVIATGGGAFARAESAQALLESAHVIYLHCDFNETFRRASLLGGRPLLEKGESEAKALFAERKDKYSRSHVTVDTTRRSPDDVVNDILVLLASWSPVH